VAAVTEIANTAVTRNRGTQEEVTNFTVKAVLTDRIPQLRPGMTATVEIETASHDNVLRAPIQAVVSRNPDRETKNYDRNLKGGKAAKGGKDAAQASESDDDDEMDAKDRRVEGVYVMRDGRAVFVAVKTGISDDRFMEIVSGLQAGDKVITGPYQTLRTLESGKKVTEKKKNTKAGADKDKKGSA